MEEKTNLQKCCDILLQVERIKEQTSNKYLVSILNDIFYSISKLLYLYKYNIDILEIERQQKRLDKIIKELKEDWKNMFLILDILIRLIIFIMLIYIIKHEIKTKEFIIFLKEVLCNDK